MKRLLVLVVLCSTALVLFPGRPALSANPVLKAIQESITALQESITGLQESITGFKWTLLNGRFTDNGDGTVKDNLTGLVWTKKAQVDRVEKFPARSVCLRAGTPPGPPLPCSLFRRACISSASFLFFNKAAFFFYENRQISYY